MKVRPGLPADAEDVLALIRSMPELPQWRREALALPGGCGEAVAGGPVRHLLAVEDGGELLGFAQIAILLGEAELEAIAVRQSGRRKGAGRLLMRGAIELARRNGARRMVLEVRRSNEAALRMYASAGFCVTGTRPRYYVDPVEDASLLQLSWA